MIRVVPGSTKWFWPGCNCNENGFGCAGHAAPPPGSGEVQGGGGLLGAGVSGSTSLTVVPNLVFSPWTVNKVVACTPFKTLSNEKVMKSGLALQDKKIRLQELTVVLPTEDGKLQPGMKVYLRGDGAVQHWAKDVFTLGDKEFILVPETAIQVVQWQNGS